MDNATQLINTIHESVSAKLAEQDTYCAAYYAADKIKATKDHEKKLYRLGWHGLVGLMVGERFPPFARDWDRVLGIGKEAVPFEAALRQIPDHYLRSLVEMLNGVTDQALRQRAYAKFMSYIGASSPTIERIFDCWGNWSLLNMMSQQASQHGVQINVQRLEAEIMQVDAIGKMYFSDLQPRHYRLHVTNGVRSSLAYGC